MPDLDEFLKPDEVIIDHFSPIEYDGTRYICTVTNRRVFLYRLEELDLVGPTEIGLVAIYSMIIKKDEDSEQAWQRKMLGFSGCSLLCGGIFLLAILIYYHAITTALGLFFVVGVLLWGSCYLFLHFKTFTDVLVIVIPTSSNFRLYSRRDVLLKLRKVITRTKSLLVKK